MMFYAIHNPERLLLTSVKGIYVVTMIMFVETKYKCDCKHNFIK